MTKVSIIIPVYKSEPYLGKCLETCVHQTCSEIEVIVVNDASPDNTGLIMEKYSNLYPNLIKCVYLKKNVRQGGARNIGIRMAKGEYITFVDSDDWIEPSMCETMYQLAVQEGDDIVFCNNYAHTENGIHVSDRFPIQLIGDKTEERLRRRIMSLRTGPVAALIKRDIFDDDQCLFLTDNLAEDDAVTKIWAVKANRIGKVEQPFYHYRLNYLSPSREINLGSYNPDLLFASCNLFDLLLKWDERKQYCDEIQVFCIYLLLNHTVKYIEKFGIDIGKVLSDDFDKCRAKLLSLGEDNVYFQRWFTPNHLRLVLEGICSYAPIDENDYKNYYICNKKRIDKVIYNAQHNSQDAIAVWSNTVFSRAFREVYPHALLIDENCVEKYEGKMIISLQMGHNANIKRNLPMAEVIDIQYCLLMELGKNT